MQWDLVDVKQIMTVCQNMIIMDVFLIVYRSLDQIVPDFADLVNRYNRGLMYVNPQYCNYGCFFSGLVIFLSMQIPWLNLFMIGTD